MALEIREIIIKTHITSDETRPMPGLTQEEREELKKEVIHECTNVVMNQLKKKTNR